MKLSVIVPTFKNPGGVKSLLASLTMQKFDEAFEVLIVANEDCPETRAVAEQFQVAKYLFAGLRGVNRARNLGLQKSTGEYVYFFDDDCVIDDFYFLQKVLLKMTSLQTPHLFFGGGYYLGESPSPVAKAYQEIQMRWLHEGVFSDQQETQYLIGGNCGGRLSSFKKFMFDENIIYGGSETELFLRAFQEGSFGIYDAEISVRHNCVMSLRDLIRKACKQSQGAIYLDRKSLTQSSPYRRLDWTALKPVNSNLYLKCYDFVFKWNYFFRTKKLKSKPGASAVFGFGFLKLRLRIKGFFFKMTALIELAMSQKK